MKLLETLRRFIDGEQRDPVKDLNDSTVELRVAEEFIRKVSQHVEDEMDKHMFRTPEGLFYFPSNFHIFLGSVDSKLWVGKKRRALSDAVSAVIVGGLKRVFGEEAVQDKITIEIKEDGTLEEGSFFVKAVLDDEAEKTVTLKLDPEGTIFEGALLSDYSSELYSIEVKRDGEVQKVIPVIKKEVTIGRGAQSVPVDVRIEGDPKVSRHHATLRVDEDKVFWLESRGTNPTLVSGHPIPKDEPILLSPRRKVEIGSFTLRIKKTKSTPNKARVKSGRKGGDTARKGRSKLSAKKVTSKKIKRHR
jgi:hypothetical protein